jgi:hypothetical protein
MLQPDEHGPATIPAEFLLAFTRAMIRELPSRDLFALAGAAAMREFPITKEQQEAFAQAVSHEASQSIWPEGFF